MANIFLMQLWILTNDVVSATSINSSNAGVSGSDDIISLIMSSVPSLSPCSLGVNSSCEPCDVPSLSWLGVVATATTAFAATSATKFAFTAGFSCV